MFLLMLGGGAHGAAATSWLFAWPIWVDGAVFLVVSVLLLALVRVPRCGAGSWPGRRNRHRRTFEGKHALVLDEVSSHHGQVKLDDSEV